MKYGFLIHLTYQVIKKYNIEDFFSVDDLYPKVVEELENFPLLNKYSNKGKNEIPLTLKTKSKYGNWINLHVSTKKQFWFIKQNDTFKFDNTLIPLLDEDIQNLLAKFDKKLNQLYLSNHLEECLELLFELISLQQCFLGIEHVDTALSYSNIASVYWDLGNYPQALEFNEKALKIRENILGTEHVDTALSYSNIASVYWDLGNYPQALEFNEKALKIRENILGTEHVDTALSYNNIANIYSSLGDHSQALEFSKKSLKVYEEILGREHVGTSTIYNDIALIYSSLGDYSQALQFIRKALKIREKVLGDNHVTTAISYNNIANIYSFLGDYSQALEFSKKALKIDEEVLGRENVDTAISYNNIALIYNDLGDYSQSLKFIKKALKVYEEVLGTKHMDTATSYNNMAEIYSSLENYSQALEFSKKALKIREEILGKKHVETAVAYNSIGKIYGILGNYSQALKFIKKALKIREEVLGIKHIETSKSYNEIALIYTDLGDYKTTLVFDKKVLRIIEEVVGKNHPDTATSYNNIADTYLRIGDHERALKFHKKALKIRKNVLGTEHVNYAFSCHHLSIVYNDLGNYKKALEFIKEAIRIRKNILGENNMLTAFSYNIASGIHGNIGDYKTAFKFQKQAVQIVEEVFGNNHPSTASFYNNISDIYSNLEDYSQALEFSKKALKIREEILGMGHVNTANSYNNISNIYSNLGDYSQALEFSKKALKILEDILGVQNVDIGVLCINISNIYTDLGDYKQSLFFLHKGLRIHRSLSMQSIYLDKHEINLYLKHLRLNQYILSLLFITEQYVKEQNKPEQVIAITKTYNTWLNYNGSIQDEEALLSIMSSLTTDEKLLFKIETLKSKKYYLAKLLQNQTSKDDQEIIDKVKKNISDIEVFLAKHIQKFKEEQELSELYVNEISSNLSQNSMFIDFVYGEDNIYIFVIHHDETINLIEVSNEDTLLINENILNFRTNLDETISTLNKMTKKSFINKKTEVNKILNNLYDVLIEKYLKEHVDNYQKLIISQDGLLNQLPFEALYDGEEYLLHQKDITYIASGKEFIRLHRFGSSTDEDISITVFANPAYDSKEVPLVEKDDDDIGDFRTMRALDAFGKCDPLPNTQEEAKAIKSVYSSSSLYTKVEADENSLKSIKNSKILHIATHGMVAENKDEKEPLLKCALALTGYNTSVEKKGEYGIFTGLKIAALDLKTTDLVVLSACESAKGSSDEVYGVSSLSRAFMMAGANATIASLWEANDVMAQQFFTRYYTKLQTQRKYAKVFKETQLEILANYKERDLDHPLFWACFCFFGVK